MSRVTWAVVVLQQVVATVHSPRGSAGTAARTCTPEAPCTYKGRGCDGENIFNVGRARSYTMSDCLALCRATKGCGGFVWDAIANESHSQCKVVKLPSAQGCCLMKRSCSPGAHKEGDTAVSFQPPPPPAPRPAPPNPAQRQWCPVYHAIHSPSLCDPSGPIQTSDGLWHIFDDCYWCSEDHDTACPWAHWVTADLLHWKRVPFSVGGCAEPNCGNTFHSTGAVSWTGSGSMVAMTNYLEPDRLQTSYTTDSVKLETWPKPAIFAPSSVFGSTIGFWDPTRAFEISERWFVGVGSGDAFGAQVLLLEATNASLTSFSKPFQLYGARRSFVSNTSISRYECPDIFYLGGKYVVLTSVEGGTQWMVGTIPNGSTPTFIPETGGYADQGHDFYAGRTGAPAELAASSRRLMFGFNGWGGGVTNGACGRYQIIPRELTVKDGFLHIAPIAELAKIRRNVTTSKHVAGAERVLIRGGSHHIEVQLNCTLPCLSPPSKSSQVNISLDVLATQDSVQLARYGYDTTTRRFFIESRGMATTDSKPQSPYTDESPSWISMIVLVDAGLVESFTDSSADMSVSSRKRVPAPNGAATTRSFLPNTPPFDLQGGAGGRGVYLSALPDGVSCKVSVADLLL